MNALSIQPTDLIRVLQNRYVPHVIRVVNLLLVIWIAGLLATLTWNFIGSSEAPENVVAEVKSAPVPVNPDIELIRKMPDWHLMGIPSREQAPVSRNTAVEAPDTRLKLVLRGSLASDDPEQARAIIADPGGKEEQYAIGDKLPGNAELSEVHPDRVILKRSGRFETLRLPKDKKSSNTVASRSVKTRAKASPQQRLSTVRQQLKQGSSNLGDLIRATPKRGKGGKTVGYTLSPGKDPNLFEQVGLQQGDVAIQINSIKLDNPANSARALKSLQSGDSVSVTVLRNGQEEVVSLEWPE
jgi:general secretion pathway protein C